jgi:hypothetical protein
MRYDQLNGIRPNHDPHSGSGPGQHPSIAVISCAICAQHRGERKDNGFVFLIVVEPNRIDVHYGVGLGLPALTAPELTSINRAAE